MNTIKIDLIVVGSCMMDFISYVPKFPNPGETIHGKQFKRAYGGKGANQAVSAALMGAKVYFIGRVGDDEYGEAYIHHLKEFSINTDKLLKTEGANTGIATILVDNTGENMIAVVAGANELISQEQIKASEKLFQTAKVLLCQLEVNIDAILFTLNIASKHNMISILNAAPANESVDELILLPTILCINELEAQYILDYKVQNIETAKIAVQDLIRKGCKNVIITLGKNGAVCGSHSILPTHVHAPEVPNVIDTTGAGDCFIGALGYYLCKNSDLSYLDQITLKACIHASQSVQFTGTQESFPKLMDRE